MTFVVCCHVYVVCPTGVFLLDFSKRLFLLSCHVVGVASANTCDLTRGATLHIAKLHARENCDIGANNTLPELTTLMPEY